jgi:hypothetical protein
VPKRLGAAGRGQGGVQHLRRGQVRGHADRQVQAVHGGPLRRRGRRHERGVLGVPGRLRVPGVGRRRRGDDEERVRSRHLLAHGGDRDGVHALPSGEFPAQPRSHELSRPLPDGQLPVRSGPNKLQTMPEGALRGVKRSSNVQRLFAREVRQP